MMLCFANMKAIERTKRVWKQVSLEVSPSFKDHPGIAITATWAWPMNWMNSLFTWVERVWMQNAKAVIGFLLEDAEPFQYLQCVSSCGFAGPETEEHSLRRLRLRSTREKYWEIPVVAKESSSPKIKAKFSVLRTVINNKLIILQPLNNLDLPKTSHIFRKLKTGFESDVEVYDANSLITGRMR